MSGSRTFGASFVVLAFPSKHSGGMTSPYRRLAVTVTAIALGVVVTSPHPTDHEPTCPQPTQTAQLHTGVTAVETTSTNIHNVG